jgi:branched-chain amino acid transport system permease protein
MPSLYLVISGLANGLLYGLLALGFVLLFKTTGVANLAIGGAATTIALVTLELYGPTGLPYGVAMLIAIVIGGLAGLLLRLTIFAAIADRPVLTLLVAAIALNLLLTGVNQFFWAQGEPYDFPRSFDSQGGLVLPGLSRQHLLILVTTVVLLSVFAFVLYRTGIGRQIRAVAEDAQVAATLGISVPMVHTVVWVFATAVVGLAAVLFAPILLLDTNNMSAVTYKAMAAAVLGGLGSLGGAVVGGLILGLIENLVVPIAPGAKEAASFLVLILILSVRPNGLFGRKSVRKL